MWQKQWTTMPFDLVAVGEDGNVRLIDANLFLIKTLNQLGRNLKK